MNHPSILVRFDDICSTMDFTQFERALILLRKYNIKPLLGVIPNCEDPVLQLSSPKSDFWVWVKELQSEGYSIAMHGYKHVFSNNNRGIVNTRYVSEFAGLSLDDQIKIISKGKDVLSKHGIETDIFFAPAHSYDENTLLALQYCGFKYMSDGKSSLPYEWHGIKCLPARSSGCPSITRSNLYTAIFHAHEWSKSEKEQDYLAFVNLLKRYHKNIVTFNEFKNVKSGNFYLERLKELFFVFIERHCLKEAVTLKHLLKL